MSIDRFEKIIIFDLYTTKLLFLKYLCYSVCFRGEYFNPLSPQIYKIEIKKGGVGTQPCLWFFWMKSIFKFLGHGSVANNFNL